MWRSHPTKWILFGCFLPALPAIPAWLLTTPLYLNQVGNSVKEVVSKTAPWADVSINGRDVVVAGDSNTQANIDQLVKILGNNPALRTVQSRARVVALQPPPEALPKLVSPTIEGVTIIKGVLSARGTWDSVHAKSLLIRVGANSYRWPQSPELTTGAGQWQLTLVKPLADGTYNVSAETADQNGATQQVQYDPVQIDTTAPAMAVLNPVVASLKLESPLSGHWAEGDARDLAIVIGDKQWQLGRDQDLSSDGQGNWKLIPQLDLPPGNYEIAITSTDAAGNARRDRFANAIVILPPAVMKPLALSEGVILTAPFKVQGSWPEAPGNQLSVQLGTMPPVLLGRDGVLSSNGQGTWTLQLPADIKDGLYDLRMQVNNAAGQPVGPSVSSRLMVDTHAPDAPTVEMVNATVSPQIIKGTWPINQARDLTVSLPALNVTAQLNVVGSPLVSDSNGNWQLTLPSVLAPGSYDIIVKVRDAQGRESADLTQNELRIAAPAPITAVPVLPSTPPQKVSPPPTAEAEVVVKEEAQPSIPVKEIAEAKPKPALVKPVRSPPKPVKKAILTPAQAKCASQLRKLGEEAPLRFGFNVAQLDPEYKKNLERYAKVLNAAPCHSVNFVLAGYADRQGLPAYNEWLSDLRAKAVAGYLATAGVKPARIKTLGKGDVSPVDPENTIKAWKRNRRVEIFVSGQK